MTLLTLTLSFFLLMINPQGYTDNRVSEPETLWLPYEEALDQAQASGKPLLIFVTAEWCVHCQTMKRESFTKNDIRRTLKQNYHPVLLDLDSREKLRFRDEEITERELARKLNVQTTPTTFFLDADEKVMGSHEGFIDTERLKDLLSFVISDHFGEMSFESYRDM